MKTILELKKDLRNEDETEGGIDRIVDYGSTEYLSDTISEIADSAVDIYYADLYKWLEDNTELLENYIQENAISYENFDLCDNIRGAQYIQYYEQYSEASDQLIRYFIYHKYFDENECLCNNTIDMIESISSDFSINDILPDQDEFTEALNDNKSYYTSDLLNKYVNDETESSQKTKFEKLEDSDFITIYNQAENILKNNMDDHDIDAVICGCFDQYI